MQKRKWRGKLGTVVFWPQPVPCVSAIFSSSVMLANSARARATAGSMGLERAAANRKATAAAIPVQCTFAGPSKLVPIEVVM